MTASSTYGGSGTSTCTFGETRPTTNAASHLLIEARAHARTGDARAASAALAASERLLGRAEAAGPATETDGPERDRGGDPRWIDFFHHPRLAADAVPEHRDALLTEEERAAGETMMICVSRCGAGGRLVLDL